MSPITTSIQDDVDAKSGLDTGVSTTTGHHAQHHIDLATGVNALVGQWIPLHVAQVNLTAAVAGTYVAVWTLAEETLASVSMQANAFYLNSADYAITGWTMQLRVVAAFMQSTTANAGTSVMTAGLYPLTMGGTTAWTPTTGTVVTGSTAAQTGGTASSVNRVTSSSFAVPTAGAYTLAVVVSTATTAGATKIPLRLEYSYTN
jgi:uncharacterized protein YaiE (UPF0345 family)